MQRLNAASGLLFALLAGAAVCHAAEQVKVEVVQTHTGVKLGTAAMEVIDSDLVWSRCSEKSGTYSRAFGFYCSDTGKLITAPSQNRTDGAFFYDVNVIMPGEAHLVFHCSTVLDAKCEGFPQYPENTSVVCGDFGFGGKAYKDCIATGSGTQGIGVYRAALHGDRMIIFGSNWRRSYLQSGTWQVDALLAQDAKPTPPQETKPASGPDSKPAAPSAGEAKPGAASTGLSPAAAAEQAIDPQIIEQAKAGDPVAQYKLGYDYFLGRAVPLDFVQAGIWWKKAADQGYPEAQNNLGVLYNSGKGVPQSYAEAYFWQNLAAARASGPLQAKFAKNRDESGSKLWLLGRLRMQQKAAKWAADHPVPARAHEPQPEAKRGEYP